MTTDLQLPSGWIAIGVGAIAFGVGAALGLPVGLLVGAGAVLTGVIVLIWSSVLSLTGSTPLTLEEAVALGAPSAEEERKRAVLRALKDLEYERGVGKISEEDYRELSQRYRGEAKELLRTLDRDLAPLRAEVLEQVEKRLEAARDPEGDAPKGKRRSKQRKLRKTGAKRSDAGSSAAEAVEAAPAPPGDDAAEPPSGDGDATTAVARDPASTTYGDDPRCEGCGVANDADARFCKGCGARLKEEPA